MGTSPDKASPEVIVRFPQPSPGLGHCPETLEDTIIWREGYTETLCISFSMSCGCSTASK